jgi:hypothetical protein
MNGRTARSFTSDYAGSFRRESEGKPTMESEDPENGNGKSQVREIA